MTDEAVDPVDQTEPTDPTKIIGHRELTEKELEVINAIKTNGNQIGAMVAQLTDILDDENNELYLDERALNIGITYLQNALCGSPEPWPNLNIFSHAC